MASLWASPLPSCFFSWALSPIASLAAEALQRIGVSRLLVEERERKRESSDLPGAEAGIRVLGDLLVGLLGGTRGSLLSLLSDVVGALLDGIHCGRLGFWFEGWLLVESCCGALCLRVCDDERRRFGLWRWQDEVYIDDVLLSERMLRSSGREEGALTLLSSSRLPV